MSDLVTFLRARLDEDEWVAQGAARDHGESWNALVTFPAHGSDPIDDHIARHDPARVLREVEARRKTLIEHRQMMPRWCITCDVPGDYQGREFGCTTIRLLALPYADHPEYRQEWRP